ncbi:MAG: hypothetical protein CO186_09725 [Zetaproteobacteria bacterium CG_4_9_14_3_um_filter_49_83]|nr:MAG: hypothetical protein AUJ56_08890 [Zetaproteobacteria bacterium CG1_02_49_23]PIQ32293.1 MAG: hypothetical protein COW62_07875 [Zetaproteobacteria bacterium CG17_big_fil_post_rev_8_21_14_2_50_50_13]PIV30068.1 MAG: hypothetical protein COS35_08695 [Zetaproteobacteria bacterium CG02_land_8_20_14_3_00_50_9]PIY56979.1 MAG: hypothetical protein COZ00_01290 [Zetaproteobacteria bacterium CG_4_10_14_0_8_um_filter_49_80]PJA34646.1 MAG: hypothetical protein CO186_09725 [Zetaproteobacteria bacterium
MNTIIRQFRALLETPDCTPEQIKMFLDQLNKAEQLSMTGDLHNDDQQRLWELSENFLTIRLTDLVPEDTPSLEPVIYAGENTLPVFQKFKKAMYRYEGNVYGANSRLLKPSKFGMGFFSVCQTDTLHEIIIDYSATPPVAARPAGWSKITPNDDGIFHHLKDHVRKISNDFYIGKATRNDHHAGYFTLCQERDITLETFKIGMMAMMPSIDGMQGVSKEAATAYIAKIKMKGNKDYLKNIKTVSWLFRTFLQEHDHNIYSFAELDCEQQESILAMIGKPSTSLLSPFYPVAEGFIRLNAGLCWGADPAVRQSLGFDIYEDEPETSLQPHRDFKQQHIPFKAQGETLSQTLFDYVIVGSGPGGAAAAFELCREAKNSNDPISIAIIEKGEWRQYDQLAHSALGVIQSLLDNQGMTVASPQFASAQTIPQWPVVHANAVGGTSVINSAIHHRTPDDILDSWFKNEPEEKSRFIALLDELETLMPTQSTETSIGDEAFDRQVNSAAEGLYGASDEYRFLDRYTDGCAAKNSCFRGCPIGAKQSLDFSLLTRALETRIADQPVVTILSNAHVQNIDIRHHQGSQNDVAQGVRGNFVHPESKTSGANFTITAKRAVIVAASAVMSPLLLKASLEKKLPDLGKHFQAHPGSNVIGVYDRQVYKLRDGHIDAVTQGWASTYYRERNDDMHTGFKLETLAAPLDLFSGRIPLSGSSLMNQLRNWHYMGYCAGLPG